MSVFISQRIFSILPLRAGGGRLEGFRPRHLFRSCAYASSTGKLMPGMHDLCELSDENCIILYPTRQSHTRMG